MKQMGNRIAVLGLCLALVLSCAGLVRADNTDTGSPEEPAGQTREEALQTAASDNETIYVLTDAAGGVKKIVISDRITDANGSETGLQTQEETELPVDVRFTYRLDGKEISPEELAGKSGRVEIRIDYENRESALCEVNGKQEELCVPFLLVSAILLDNENFSNVSVENGKLLNDGSRSIVVGYALPGMQESLALPEDVELTIPDHVTLTADATDFRLGSVYTLATNSLLADFDEKDPDALTKLVDSMNDLTDAMDQLLSGAEALHGGLDTLLARSGELTDGVAALCGGADRVSAGTDALANGAKDLASGAQDVRSGAGQLAQGAGSLLSGAEQLFGGAQTLSAGLDRLSGSSAALNSGAQTVFNSLLSAAETQLKANGLDLAHLTIGNYQQELTRVIGTLDPDAVYAAALAQVTAAVEAKRPEIEALVTAAVREQVTQAVTAAVRQNVTEQVRAAAEAQVRAQVEANRALIEAQVSAAIEAQIRAQVTEAVEAQVRAQVIQAATGMSVEEYEQALANGSVDESIRAAVEAQISAQMASDEIRAAIEAQTAQQLAGEQAQSLIAATTDEKVEQTVQEKLASSEVQALIDRNVEAQMASAEVQALIGQNVEAQMQSEQIRQAIADNTEAQVKQAIADTMAGEEVQGKLAAAAEGAKSVIALKTSLDQYDAFYHGVLSYTAGVDAAAQGAAALSAGAKELKDGAARLADGSAALSAGTDALSQGAGSLSEGAAALSEGANTLAGGAHTLESGLPALLDGIRQLRDGSAELESGLKRFDEEGVQKLAKLVTEDAEGLAERLKAVASLGKHYRASFTGLSEDVAGNVKFLFRSDAIGE